MALLALAQALLIVLAFHCRLAKAQEAVEMAATSVTAGIGSMLSWDLHVLVCLPELCSNAAGCRHAAKAILVRKFEVRRIERLIQAMEIHELVEPPLSTPLPNGGSTGEKAHGRVARRDGGVGRPTGAPIASPNRSLLNFWTHSSPSVRRGRATAFWWYSLPALLQRAAARANGLGRSLTLPGWDGTRLVYANASPIAREFVARWTLGIPGAAMALSADSTLMRPSWVPDTATSLVIGLSGVLAVVVLLLVRETRRRARAEEYLGEALAFRKAIESSVVIGLRACDATGTTSYVNATFCKMVGCDADGLVGRSAALFWPDEGLAPNSRESFETTYVRKGGESFPVLVFEGPLVDGAGGHKGWITGVLDLTAQRRIEDHARQQQERMQASARLATLGEMASLLSHELNQPLAAIASFATASLNMIEDRGSGITTDAELWAIVQQAARTIAEQAERAGSVIKSVQDFVRRRERDHEVVGLLGLVEAILPLIRLQARKSGACVTILIPEDLPNLLCDRSMVEQVILNLARNGIQAMQNQGEPGCGIEVSAELVRPSWVQITVRDQGPGVSADVADKLFTPFFTTRSDGMGLGLSLSRTIVEQHGGALEFENVVGSDGRVLGALFRFTLPLASATAATARAGQSVETAA